MTDAVATPLASHIPSVDAATLLASAMKLPVKDRAFLAERLISSLDDDLDEVPMHGTLAEAAPLLGPGWMEEIERRLESVRRGEAVLLDGEEVFRELLARRSS
ncbi:MAG: addiction module protein [Planctomycetaceae bacterium]|nr:addiction module protein [Planctomycetaceae bacterium]